MSGRLDFLSDAVPGRTAWRFKVHVGRLWEVKGYMRPDQVNSVEMVLIDSKGGKINATIRKQLLYLFQRKVDEGLVYVMSFFTVTPSCGAYRSTMHPYKLVFQMKTKIELCECPEIPRYGLSLSSIGEISALPNDYDYLVDTIGMLTGLSSEREYIRDSKITKMIVLELTDQTGKIECALFGSYVAEFQSMVASASDAMPVVVVQYAKIKLFRDSVSIQNVVGATRVLVDPHISEAVAFKDGLAVHGIEANGGVAVLGPRVRPSMEEDFLHSYPVLSVTDLHLLVDDGTFVVAATIIGVVQGDDWWYPACKCHKSITRDSGAYYCSRCVKHVFQMTPRYRVKLIVTDGSGDAVFVVFDGDMQYLLGERCADLVAAAGPDNAVNYPSQILALEGKKVLFKVARVTSIGVLFDGSFRVKRVCTDPDIMKCFDSLDRSIVAPKVADKPNVVCDDQISGGLPTLSEAGVDDFVSGLLVSPAESSADQVGLSDPGSIEKTPVRSSVGSIVSLDGDEVDDATPISVLLPRSGSDSLGASKRNLDSAFDELGEVVAVPPLKTSKI